MVEIIKESNPDLNKRLFLKELSKKSDGVELEISRVSEPYKTRDKKGDLIYVDFHILSDFKAPLTVDESGDVINEIVDATDDIIAISFPLGATDNNENYAINTGKNIYNILNHAMKEKKMIPANNNKSFKADYDEIESALINFKFIGVSKFIKSKEFQNYYRLEVKG